MVPEQPQQPASGSAPRHGEERPSPFRGFAQAEAPVQDAAYLRRLAEQMLRVQQQGARTREDVRHTRRELARVQDRLKREIAMIRDELALLRAETDTLVRTVESAVIGFRHLARAGDSARLLERVDTWNPEQRVTREQVAQMVRDAMAR